MQFQKFLKPYSDDSFHLLNNAALDDLTTICNSKLNQLERAVEFLSNMYEDIKTNVEKLKPGYQKFARRIKKNYVNELNTVGLGCHMTYQYKRFGKNKY